MKKLCNLIIGMMLLCSMSAFAKLTVECEPQTGTVVKGYSETAKQKVTVYATSEGEKVTNLSLLFKLPDGLGVADGQTEGDTESVTFTDAIISANAIIAATVFDGELEIVVAPSIAASIGKLDVTNLPSGVRTALFEIEFAIDLDATDATTLTPQIDVTECSTYTDDVESVTDDLKLSFSLFRETYGFTTNADAKVVLTEDDDPVSIAATDKSLFTAQVWDVEKGGLVDTDAVEFTDATPSDAAAGTVAVDGGKIVYTPAENWNGDFAINYTVKFTELDVTTEGSIDVTVNAVNDKPEIAIVTEDLAVNEGESLSFDMSFFDVDTAWEGFTKTVMLGGTEIAGIWERKVGVPEADLDIYTFTADAPVDFDAVKHPARMATSALTVEIVDMEDAASKETAGADVTINDVDQPTNFDALAVAVTASSDPAVFGSKLTAVLTGEAVDADGDVAEIAYQWYRNGEAVAGETTTALKTAVKKGENWTIEAVATVKPYGDDSTAEEIKSKDDFEINTITIDNTLPERPDDLTLYIIKGTETSKDTPAIKMVDVDDDELEIVITDHGNKNATVEVKDNVISYTVADGQEEEYFGDDADQVKYIVREKDNPEAASEEATLTVNYRENEPPRLTTDPEDAIEVDEVDAEENATSIAITFNASDDDGIESVTCTVPEGWDEVSPLAGEGQTSVNGTFTVKTKGYETLQGAGRNPEEVFTIKLTAKDSKGGERTVEINVTVKDVDRMPTAPVTVAIAPDAPKTESVLTAEADGSVDPDEDDVTYKYEWYVDDVKVEDVDGAELANDNFVKNQKVFVKAYAVTKPYGEEDEKISEEKESDIIEIANTDPALVKVDDAKLEAEEDLEATIALNELVDAVDPDVADGVDTLTFTVTPNFGEEVGTLSYDAEAGVVTFMPAENYNTEGLEVLPTFSVTVSDGEAETEAVEVEITVAAVNDAPTATVADVFIQPDQAGQDVTVALAVTAGPEDESAQQSTLESSEYIAPEDGKALLDGFEVYVDVEAKTMNFTFTVSEDAEIGAEGAIKFTIKDDAGAVSEEYTFKIVLSGTPWYPSVVLPCEHDTEGVVVRMTVDGKQTDVVVKEKNEDDKFVLTPAVYYNSGFKGFDRNAQGDITVYHWSAKSGTGAKCGEIEDGIKVPDYQAPGKPSIEGTDNPNAVKVTAPLASGFELVVTDAADDSVVTYVAQDFIPAENGQMETSATVTLAGLESGKTYNVIAKGINPMGEYGEQCDAFELTTGKAEEWPGNGEFFPPQNWTTTVATDTTNINFKWPVNAKADTYTLRLLDGDGKEERVYNRLTVNSICITDIPVGNYRWYVETSNGEKSDMMLFTITKTAGGDAVITGGYGYRNVLTLFAENLVDGKAYQFDVIYFDDVYKLWAYQLFVGEVSGNNQLTLYGDDVEFFGGANYIMIRPHGNGGDYQTLLINNDEGK